MFRCDVVVITNLLGGLSAIVDGVVALVVDGAWIKRVFCCQCRTRWQIVDHLCNRPSMTCGNQYTDRTPDHLVVRPFSTSFGILPAVIELMPDLSVVATHSFSSWVLVEDLRPLNLFVCG